MLNNFLILSHRGVSAVYPENTMLSFRKALEYGMDGIELDVQFSKDKELVVIHDETLDRTTDGKGYVKDKTLEELKKLDAGSFKSSEYKGEKIPTLDEVLELFKGKEKVINIELKTGQFAYDGIEEKVIESIKKYNLEKYVYITSFNHQSFDKFRKLTTEIESGVLLYDTQFDICKYIDEYNIEVINPSIEYFNLCKNDFMSMKKQGKKVSVYTVNDKEEMKKLKNLGINIITDIAITKEEL